MANTLIWGNSSWKYLHSLSYYVDQDRENLAALFANTILSWCSVIPCIACRNAFSVLFVSNYGTAKKAHSAILETIRNGGGSAQKIAYEFHKGVSEHIAKDRGIPFAIDSIPTEEIVLALYNVKHNTFTIDDAFIVLILYTFDYHPGDSGGDNGVIQMKFWMITFMKGLEVIGMGELSNRLKHEGILNANVYSIPAELMNAIYRVRKHYFPDDEEGKMREYYEQFKTNVCDASKPC